SSTWSSSRQTSRASSRSRFTKESTLSVTIRMTALDISSIRWRPGPSGRRTNRVSSAMSAAWSPIRSRSEIIFSAEEISRRSRATGCCSSSSFRQRFSTSRSFWSISRSASPAARARSSSPFIRAWAAAEMASSHRAPIWIISTCSRSSCSPNLFLTLRPSLAEPAGDVVFCALVRGGGEQCLRPAELHQIPQQEKRRVVGDTGGLLHIVGHHDDSILAFQFHCKVFDLGGGDGVQGAGGLIHQQDLRLHCQGTGNAQPLLLAAGEAQGTLLQ
ncbi:selenium-dependent molybdenum cofactor biosynthesis protein YqeB, partial [Dysosmobacter welbionis]